MNAFAPPEIVTDRATLKARAVEVMERELPGWHLEPGSPEDAILEAWAFVASEQAEILVAQTVAPFRSLAPLFGVEPIEATPATAALTITAIDTLGHTYNVGEVVVGIRDVNAELQGFRLAAPVTIPAGSSSAVATVEAEAPGAAANGLSGAVQLIEAPASIASATMATSGNGVDAEEDSVFLNRFAESLGLIKPAPVRAESAAIVARSIPGIGRATAVDNLKPSAADGGEGVEERNVEKCVTVACTDVNGVASDASHLAAVKAKLQEEREVNFLFFAVAPHYQAVDVTVKAFAWPGQNLAAVKTAIQEALERYLSPARFATDATGIPARWANDPFLRLGSLFDVVMSVTGVRWAPTLTFAKHGEAQGTADVNLAGASAVPALPTLTNSVFTIAVEPST